MSEVDRDQTRPDPNRAARERLRGRKPIVLHSGVNRSLRMAAIASWVAAAILSLMRGGVDVHTGAHHGFLFTAYALSAAITKCGFASVETRRQIVAFSLASVLFELGAAGLSGRAVDGSSLMAGAAGALMGLTVGRYWYKWRLRVSVR